MARSSATSKRKPNRVDSLRSIDRYTTAKRAPGVAARGGVPQSQGPVGRNSQPIAGRRPTPGRPQPGRPGPGGPQMSQPFTPPGAPGAPVGVHPFIPGAPMSGAAPAGQSQPGSPPGTPNIGQAVMRSFQPSVLERTPLVSGGAGVPQQGGQQMGGMSFNPQQQGQPQPSRGFM
jgi:hypothetical protein